MLVTWGRLQLCHSILQNDASRWPLKSLHCNNESATALSSHKHQAPTLYPVVCDASNQPTSGSDRHQSAMVSITRSMNAHIRDGRYHPQGAICSTFHLKVPLPSICMLGAHFGEFLRSRRCGLDCKVRSLRHVGAFLWHLLWPEDVYWRCERVTLCHYLQSPHNNRTNSVSVSVLLILRIPASLAHDVNPWKQVGSASF